MKKITLLILLLTIPFVGFSQTWDFTADAGGWTGSGATLSHTGATNDPLVITFTDTQKNPKLIHATANIDATTNVICAITLKNNSDNEYLRVSHLKTGGSGRTYVNLDINANDSSYKTYYFEMTNANWGSDNGGIENDINIHIRGAGNTDNMSNGNIEFDKIEFTAPGLSSKISYDFASDDITGFAGVSGGIVTDGGTILNFVGDGTNTAPKFSQTFYNVDASTNQYAHIVVDNNASNADQIKFQFVDAGSTVQTYGNQTLNSGTSTVIDVDLSGKAEWTGNITEWRFVFSVSGGGNVDTGLLEISKIVFDNDAVLATDKVVFKDDASISLYPNPSSNTISISSSNSIEKMEVYTVLGKKAMTSKTNTINISNLAAGMYIAKIYQEGNIISTKRFIKQ